MTLDKHYWKKRYQEKQTGWDIGYVSTPLKEYFDKLEDFSLNILIPGAGNAHEAIYLWEKGFQHVHILDIAEEPLHNLKLKNPTFPDNHIHCEDFFFHADKYDLIIEQTFFCALEPSLRNAYVDKMFDLLNPGGKLVGVLFNCEFESNPPFGGNEDEYRILFQSRFPYLHLEPCRNSIEPRTGRELFIIVKKEN